MSLYCPQSPLDAEGDAGTGTGSSAWSAPFGTEALFAEPSAPQAPWRTAADYELAPPAPAVSRTTADSPATPTTAPTADSSTTPATDPTTDSATDPTATCQDDDGALPPPRPEERLRPRMATADRHRLDLQTALTAAGVAPAPGDAAALRALAQLDDATVDTVISWIRAATRAAAWTHAHLE